MHALRRRASWLYNSTCWQFPYWCFPLLASVVRTKVETSSMLCGSWGTPCTPTVNTSHRALLRVLFIFLLVRTVQEVGAVLCCSIQCEASALSRSPLSLLFSVAFLSSFRSGCSCLLVWVPLVPPGQCLRCPTTFYHCDWCCVRHRRHLDVHARDAGSCPHP
jgi:hypothetical protein